MKLKNLFAAGAAVVLGLGLAASVQAAGDPAKGQALYATCASCHGANGEGNQALNAPAIAGQQDWYLTCLLYTSPSPRDYAASRMPSSA